MKAWLKNDNDADYGEVMVAYHRFASICKGQK